MFHSEMDKQLILSGNEEFDSFTEGYLPGELICIVNQPEYNTNSFIYRLFREFSNKYVVGFIITNMEYVRSQAWELENRMCYSNPMQLLEEIKIEVDRLSGLYGDVIIFINDLGSIFLALSNASKSRNAELSKICYGLKRIALQKKTTIITGLMHEFKSDRSLNRFNLQGLRFLEKGIHAFDKIYEVKKLEDHLTKGIQNKDSFIIKNLLSVNKKLALVNI